MNLSTIKTMATFSPRSHSHSRYRTRSASFPARSHPSTIKIEQVINKIKNLAAEKPHNSLCHGLVELYECIEELLALPVTQQALLQHQESDNLVTELLERSVRFIDICSCTRDTVMLMKAGVRQLQSAIQRSKIAGDHDHDHLRIQSNVENYISSRRNTQKEIIKSVTKLKLIDNNALAIMSTLFTSESQLCSIIRVLVEASCVTISTFQSFLMILSVPVLKPKPTKWSLVLKFVHKGALLATEVQRKELREMEKLDISLNNYLMLHNEEEAENIKRNLESLDSSMENVENGLEKLLRLFIRTRVSLLNILSDQ